MGVGQDEGTGGGIPGDGSPTKVLVASIEGGRGGATTAPHLAFAVTLGVSCLMITVAQTWTGSPNELAKQTAVAFCLSFRMYTSTADPPTPSVRGVVDFGLSKQHIYGSNFGVKTLSGTAEYVAPEALAQSADGSRNYGKAYDWWSLGVVIYEMLVGESPFYEENEHKMLSRIAFSDVAFPSDFPRDAYELVNGLLSKDPKQRLGSEQMGGVDGIKRCQFFRHIDWDKLLRREVKAHWTPKLSGETDTRYVDPEFIDEGPPSAAYDPSADSGNSSSKRFSQFSFNYSLG